MRLNLVRAIYPPLVTLKNWESSFNVKFIAFAFSILFHPLDYKKTAFYASVIFFILPLSRNKAEPYNKEIKGSPDEEIVMFSKSSFVEGK